MRRRAIAIVMTIVCALSAAATARPIAQSPVQAPVQPLTPSGPQSQADPTGVQASLAEARQLFDALDYEQALVRLDTIVAQLQARRVEPAIQAAIAAGPPPGAAASAATGAAQSGGQGGTQSGTAASESGSVAAQAAAITRALVEALELRARAHFGVGQTELAREDFRALLTLRADYAPGETVSPRVIAFFNTVRGELIGQVQLTIDPPDAIARIDGIRIGPSGQPIDIVAGPHVLGIVRPGYRPETRDFLVDPGKLSELSVAMTRNSSILAIVTRPAGVEVKLDGVAVGTTQPLPNAAGIGADEANSAPLFVPDLATGTHRVELSRTCHETATATVTVEQLGDYRVGPIVLKPAVGELRIGSSQAADIYLDGERRGGAPQTLARICAGEHVIEARTASGRDLRRVTVASGAREEITLTPRPALALLANAGLLSGAPEDVRSRVERALGSSSRLLVLSPPIADVRRVEGTERAPAGWLAVGPGGQPGIGSEWRSASAAAGRRDLSMRLAKALGAQGLVAISRAPDRVGFVWLTILAAGASEPDVIPLELDRPAAAVRALDAAAAAGAAPLLRRTLDLALVDVLHRPGPVVLSVGPVAPVAAPADGVRASGAAAGAAGGATTAAATSASPAPATAPAAAGLVPGDALISVNGQTVTSVQDVRRVLEAIGSPRTVRVTAKSRAGQDKSADLPLLVEPRLVTPPLLAPSASPPSAASSVAPEAGSAAPAPGAGSAQSAAHGSGVNVLLLDLRARLAEADGAQSVAVRLNLASALVGAGDPDGALTLLDELQPTRGAQGPSQTLALIHASRAVALEALGRIEEAQAAWRAAAESAPGVSVGEEEPSIGAVASRRVRGATTRGTGAGPR